MTTATAIWGLVLLAATVLAAPSVAYVVTRFAAAAWFQSRLWYDRASARLAEQERKARGER